MSSIGDKMVPFLSDCVLRTEGHLYAVRSRQQAVLSTNMCGRHGTAVSAEEDNLYRVLPGTTVELRWVPNNAGDTQLLWSSHTSQSSPHFLVERVLERSRVHGFLEAFTQVPVMRIHVDTFRELAAWRFETRMSKFLPVLGRSRYIPRVCPH